MNRILMTVIIISATIPLIGCGHTTVRTSPQPVAINDARAVRYQTLIDMAIHKPGERELRRFYHLDREAHSHRPVPGYGPPPSSHHRRARSASRPAVPKRGHRYKPDHPATGHRVPRPLPVVRLHPEPPESGNRTDKDRNRRHLKPGQIPATVVRQTHPASTAKAGQNRNGKADRRKRSHTQAPVGRQSRHQATSDILIVKQPTPHHIKPARGQQPVTTRQRGKQPRGAVTVNHPGRIHPEERSAIIKAARNNREHKSNRTRKNLHRQPGSRDKGRAVRLKQVPDNANPNDTGDDKRTNRKGARGQKDSSPFNRARHAR